MLDKDIQSQVENAINSWAQQRSLMKRQIEVSKGAKEMLAQMVINIDRDPSSVWKQENAEATQRYAISVIPNVLNELDRRARYSHSKITKFSSWELLHGMSNILDSWCPIPKNT